VKTPLLLFGFLGSKSGS